jgi:V/A-type H+-transporting ATPase subunit F
VKKIFFVTMPDAEYGFSLAGIPQQITTEDRVEEVLPQALSAETGLVVIDERLTRSLSDERLRQLLGAWQGILLLLPSPERPAAVAEDYIARLIRRAIGYQVRLTP